MDDWKSVFLVAEAEDECHVEAGAANEE